MSKPETKQPKDSEPSEAERFDQLTRALFRVDKRDVEKHEPQKRGNEEEPLPN